MNSLEDPSMTLLNQTLLHSSSGNAKMQKKHQLEVRKTLIPKTKQTA
jgi:hypothetical protein